MRADADHVHQGPGSRTSPRGRRSSATGSVPASSWCSSQRPSRARRPVPFRRSSSGPASRRPRLRPRLRPRACQPRRSGQRRAHRPAAGRRATPAATERAAALLGASTTASSSSSSPDAAEMAKLLENTFRNVNIAFVNQLALLCERMGLDVWEVIDAAATKPFGFMRFTPGPGVGGHCIPVDPYYLAWRAREFDFTDRFIELAGDINFAMPRHVVDLVAEALNDRGKALNGAAGRGHRGGIQAQRAGCPQLAGGRRPGASSPRRGGRVPRPAGDHVRDEAGVVHTGVGLDALIDWADVIVVGRAPGDRLGSGLSRPTSSSTPSTARTGGPRGRGRCCGSAPAGRAGAEVRLGPCTWCCTGPGGAQDFLIAARVLTAPPPPPDHRLPRAPFIEAAGDDRLGRRRTRPRRQSSTSFLALSPTMYRASTSWLLRCSNRAAVGPGPRLEGLPKRRPEHHLVPVWQFVARCPALDEWAQRSLRLPRPHHVRVLRRRHRQRHDERLRPTWYDIEGLGTPATCRRAPQPIFTPAQRNVYAEQYVCWRERSTSEFPQRRLHGRVTVAAGRSRCLQRARTTPPTWRTSMHSLRDTGSRSPTSGIPQPPSPSTTTPIFTYDYPSMRICL